MKIDYRIKRIQANEVNYSFSNPYSTIFPIKFLESIDDNFKQYFSIEEIRGNDLDASTDLYIILLGIFCKVEDSFSSKLQQSTLYVNLNSAELTNKNVIAIYELIFSYLFKNYDLKVINFYLDITFEHDFFELFYGIRKVGLKTVAFNNNQQLVINFEALRSTFNNRNVSANSSQAYGINNQEFLKSEKNRLKIQTCINFDYINSVINKLKVLKKYFSIIDLGCGNGEFAKLVNENHPKIKIIGVETNSEFFCEAKKLENNQMKFIQGDIITETNKLPVADLYILRYVAQHIGPSNLTKLLDNLRDIINSSSRILIIDSDGRYLINEPKCYAAEALLHSTLQGQLRYGGDREIGCKLFNIAKQAKYQVEDMNIHIYNSFNMDLKTFFDIGRPGLYSKPDKNIIANEELYAAQKAVEQWIIRGGYFQAGMLSILIKK